MRNAAEHTLEIAQPYGRARSGRPKTAAARMKGRLPQRHDVQGAAFWILTCYCRTKQAGWWTGLSSCCRPSSQLRLSKRLPMSSRYRRYQPHLAEAEPSHPYSGCGPKSFRQPCPAGSAGSASPCPACGPKFHQPHQARHGREGCRPVVRQAHFRQRQPRCFCAKRMRSPQKPPSSAWAQAFLKTPRRYRWGVNTRRRRLSNALPEPNHPAVSTSHALPRRCQDPDRVPRNGSGHVVGSRG